MDQSRYCNTNNIYENRSLDTGDSPISTAPKDSSDYYTRISTVRASKKSTLFLRIWIFLIWEYHLYFTYTLENIKLHVLGWAKLLILRIFVLYIWIVDRKQFKE